MPVRRFGPHSYEVYGCWGDDPPGPCTFCGGSVPHTSKAVCRKAARIEKELREFADWARRRRSRSRGKKLPNVDVMLDEYYALARRQARKKKARRPRRPRAPPDARLSRWRRGGRA